MIVQLAFWACWTLAAIFNSLTDYFGFEYSSKDWDNKYAQPLQPAPHTWYYRLIGVPYKERFPLSTNVLSFLTDKFHFYQFCQTTLVIVCLFIGQTSFTFSWLRFVVVTVWWGIVTHTSYIVISHKK